MSQVVIENPIINPPFDDAKHLGVPSLEEAGFRKLLSRNEAPRLQNCDGLSGRPCAHQKRTIAFIRGCTSGRN